MNPQGFHARPAHLFVKLASQFQAQIEILKGNEVINGKNILDLLTMGAGNGTTLTLRASGPDAENAVAALAQLVEGGFGEMGPAPAP
jgi:phosphotransferase system HPr (HPr) family protein